MLDTKDIMDVITDHLAANDTYRLSEDEHLTFLQDLETITNLVTAAKIDAATHAEERGLHARYGCKSVSVLLREKLKLNHADATRRTRLVHELPALPHTREAVYAV